MKLQEQQVELTAPVTGKKIVIRGYITGRMRQSISAVYLSASDSNLESDGKGDNKKSYTRVPGMVIQQTTNKALELVVLSVDGDTNDVLEKVLDLPEEDYDFVVAEVNKVTAPLAKKNQADSSTASTTPPTGA